MTMKDRITRAILKRRFYDCEPDMYGRDLERFFAEMDEDTMHEARSEAEAVLDALREPDEAMVWHGASALDHPSVFMGGPSHGNKRNAQAAWQAMIDAAKAEDAT